MGITPRKALRHTAITTALKTTLKATCWAACWAALPAAAHPDAHSTPKAEAEAEEMAEVHVHASALDVPVDETTTPVELLDDQALRLRRAGTLGETLDGLAGVRNNHFGAGAGRPVIRGADSARVRILSDGAEVQDASTSSPDHAVALDAMLATQVDILRGPSTLLYGGGITGGLVNVHDGKVPTRVPAGGFAGAVEVQKDTAAREGVGMFTLTGGTGPLALHVGGIKRSAGDYRTGKNWEHGRTVEGSHNRSWTGTVGASLVHEKGYLGLAYTRLQSQYGLPGHTHDYADCHLHGNHLHCGSHSDASANTPANTPEGCHWHGATLHCTGTGGDAIPLVDLRSDRWDLRGQWRDPLPGITRAKLRAGLTDYRHDEIENGHIGTRFTNKAYDSRLELEHQRIGNLRGVVGVQAGQRKFAATGSEAYVEPSKTRNLALFALEEYTPAIANGNLRLELALRYEWQRAQLHGRQRNAHARHDMGSASAGVSWSFAPDYVLAANFSYSGRAPTAEELFANGIHLASNTYERGNLLLKAERAHNIDLILRKTRGTHRFQITGYHNRIANYIYAATTDQHENFRLIDYRQQNARFTGLEVQTSHQLSPQWPHWRLGLVADAVHAQFAGGSPIPRIPAHRLGLNLDWQNGPWHAGVQAHRHFAQKRIAAHESATPGYTLLNLHASYHGHAPGYHWELYAKLDNALDALALNHASFIKNQSPLRGRNLRVGVRVDF